MKQKKYKRPIGNLPIFSVVRSYIAVLLWAIRIKPSISTFIDEDTIIMGYGQLRYEFYYPLPNWIVKLKYGTISWNVYLKDKR